MRSLAELERIKHELKLEGVVWHSRFQGVALDHQLMRPLLRKVRELKLVPVFHTNAESNLEAVWRLERLALEFFRPCWISVKGGRLQSLVAPAASWPAFPPRAPPGFDPG